MTNQIFDRDDYPSEPVPDLKAEALARLNSAAAYARLHAPEVFAEWVEAARERGAPEPEYCGCNEYGVCGNCAAPSEPAGNPNHCYVCKTEHPPGTWCPEPGAY